MLFPFIFHSIYFIEYNFRGFRIKCFVINFKVFIMLYKMNDWNPNEVCCLYHIYFSIVQSFSLLHSDLVQNVNILRQKQNGHLISKTFCKVIFSYEMYCILIQISPKYLLKGEVYKNPTLVRLIAWSKQATSQYTYILSAWLMSDKFSLVLSIDTVYLALMGKPSGVCCEYLGYCSGFIMSVMASQITSVLIVCSSVCLGVDQRQLPVW